MNLEEQAPEPTRPVRNKKRPRNANEEYDVLYAPAAKSARTTGQAPSLPSHVLEHADFLSAAHSAPEWAELLQRWRSLEQLGAGNKVHNHVAFTFLFCHSRRVFLGTIRDKGSTSMRNSLDLKGEGNIIRG